jgi:hypothetical protein
VPNVLDLDPLAASCRLDDLESARAIPGSAALERLVAEFDRVWGAEVERSRDLVKAVQTLAA